MSQFEGVFAEPDWILRKYQNWTAEYESIDWLVLKKDFRIFTKRLVIQKNNAANVPDIKFNLKNLAETHFFFKNESSATIYFPNMRLEKAKSKERILNEKTALIDLSKPEGEHWQSIGNKSRNMIRKAQESNHSVYYWNSWSDDWSIPFIELHHELKRKTGIPSLNISLLKKIANDGRLLIAAVRSNEKVCAISLIFLGSNYGYYLHGAIARDAPKGSGQWLQWEIAKILREKKLKYYDLGGIAPEEENQGIEKFKKSIAPTEALLGKEFIFTPIYLKIFLKIFRFLRSSSHVFH